MESDVRYLCQRASEETILSLHESDKLVADSRRRLAVQLLILARFKASGGKLTPVRYAKTPKSGTPVEQP